MFLIINQYLYVGEDANVLHMCFGYAHMQTLTYIQIDIVRQKSVIKTKLWFNTLI